MLKSCSWLKVFSAANGLECIRGQSNPLSNFVLSAKLCPIFALSARLCCFSTAAIERECSCLSAKICRFWRPLIAVSDTKDMEGLSVSRDFLGLPLELSFPMYGRYKIVKTYLSDIPNSDRGAGLILADCEGDEPFAQDVLNTLRKDVKDL